MLLATNNNWTLVVKRMLKYCRCFRLFLTSAKLSEPCTRPGAGDRALHEVLERCETPEDGALALKALRTLRRHRAALQLHSDFTRYTSNLFLDVRVLLCPRPEKRSRSPMHLHVPAGSSRCTRWPHAPHPPQAAAQSCAGRDSALSLTW